MYVNTFFSGNAKSSLKGIRDSHEQNWKMRKWKVSVFLRKKGLYTFPTPKHFEDL